MYIGHGRLCVCLTLAACPHCCTDPDITYGNGRRCPLVVHYWADLQSVHGFGCYDNIAQNAKCQRVLVLAQCLATFRVSGRRPEMYSGHARLSVSVSVRCRMPTLLHGPEYNLGEWYRDAPSCALLGGFVIGARVALLWQHNANAKCQRVTCLCSLYA